jgi:hypothetical protein
MLDNEFDYERLLESQDDLCQLLREIPEKNIAFAFTGRPYPFYVHVIRKGTNATVREMSYEVLKRTE